MRNDDRFPWATQARQPRPRHTTSAYDRPQRRPRGDIYPAAADYASVQVEGKQAAHQGCGNHRMTTGKFKLRAKPHK
jgi:hypothetical protein